MANIIGTVVKIDLDVQVAKNGGGTYPGWKLIYEDQRTGDVKTFQKHANTLKYTPALVNGLQELSAGDVFTLETEKNDKGFLDPKAIYKGAQQAAPAQQAQPVRQANAIQAPASTNTFEVNNILKEKQMKLDEVRQPLIVRQTCLKAAADLATVFKLKTEKDVIEQANRFVDYINGKQDVSAIGAIEDMEDDIPL